MPTREVLDASKFYAPQPAMYRQTVLLQGGFDAGLWVTNGTAAGTYELTGISGTNTDVLGYDPQDFVVFNGEVLFSARDDFGQPNLWITDGTAASTYEIGGLASRGISGVNGSGLNPSNLAVFNGEVLFAGTDLSGAVGLWVTNGTAMGTYELTGIANAAATGINPSNFAILNGEVLFAGTDASDDVGLWVTNGTATREWR
jgi:ELWxxDGT repeat protein